MSQPAELEVLKRWLEQSKFKPGPREAVAMGGSTDTAIAMLFVMAHVAEGGLDLRTHASILKGKISPAIVPGNPAESLILQRIHAGEMPPKRRIVEASIKVITAQ